MEISALLSGHVSTKGIVIVLSLVASVILNLWLIGRYLARRKHRPRIAKEQIVYRESFASGASQKNILTRLGGAHNCLRLVVTSDLLWITSWFPFGFIASIYDLEHVVPLSAISSVERKTTFGTEFLLITFTNTLGESGSIAIRPKDPVPFLEALHLAPEVWHGPQAPLR